MAPEGEPDPTTQELKLSQLRRERELRRHAEDAPHDEDTGQLEARADKAAYLREKLEEREQAEREAD
ncbi:MAG: hypothetical protein QOJ07_3600 [Thermoleophilaceae bacterium]|jgi:hypothetical protein|nr:hypothetical protein [Thermoleophilaceae bacterium]